MGKDGRRPDLESDTAVKDMPASDNVTTLQSFFGLANYYQRFIKNWHNLRAPLNEQLKQDKKWRCTSECQTAFDIHWLMIISLTLYDVGNSIIIGPSEPNMKMSPLRFFSVEAAWDFGDTVLGHFCVIVCP